MRSRTLLLVVALLALSACGHRPLKAPCEPGDAQPLSALIVGFMPAALLPLAQAILRADECGPLRSL